MVLRRNDTRAGHERQRQRRQAPRRRMLKDVQVLSLDKKVVSAIDLTLRNMSATGAQLFGSAKVLGRIPDEFYLVPSGQLRMIRCRLAWKGEHTAGVSFLSDPGSFESQTLWPDASPRCDEF